MRLLLLYGLLLKATLTTFSGLASLPVLRNDLVLRYGMITDRQLDTAVVVTRTTPGPVGVYLVSVGYFADGIPGAIAGWLAMVTPALLIIPLLRFASTRAENPRVKSMIHAVVLASAGLLWSSAIPLTQEIVNDPFTWFLLIACIGILLTRKVESVWVVLSAAVIELTLVSIHLVRVPM